MMGRPVHTAFVPLTVLVAGLVTACTTGPRDYLSYSSRSDPASVIRRVADQVGECWFADQNSTFRDLIYVPERNAGTSRVLIVEKSDPGGLPQLVITAQADGRRTDIRLFGPLLASAEGTRIEADIGRWAGGKSGCR